jgi:hypothetical protein
VRNVEAVLIFTVVLALRASAETTDWRGALFRSINEAPAIKIVSDDELEFTPERDGPNLVCKYSRNGDMLLRSSYAPRLTTGGLLQFIPEGLQCADGSILYDSAHFEAASRAAREASAAERERQLAAARAATPIPAPSPASTLSGPAAKAFAISAPRPEYPYEMRTRHITGSGVVLMIIDVPSGLVTDVSMAQHRPRY